jgi:glycosyltransferase involved in cell wall biosynthesis
VLVEDASPDDSLAVCQALVAEYPDRVRLFRHPGGENRGAGASRNLAIEKSRYPFIAFLDADDYYLPGRFTVARRVFEEKPYVDGVYEAVGSRAVSDAGRSRVKAVGMSQVLDQLTIFAVPLEGTSLFRESLRNLRGHIHLDGLTIRKAIADEIGQFDEQLRLHQDTAFLFRLMAKGYLAPGQVDSAVAIRQMHENNRITAPRSSQQMLANRLLLADTVIGWSLNHIDRRLMSQVVFKYRVVYERMYCNEIKNWFLVYRCVLKRLTQTLRKYPFVSRDRRFWIQLSPYPELVRLLPQEMKDALKRILNSNKRI